MKNRNPNVESIPCDANGCKNTICIDYDDTIFECDCGAKFCSVDCGSGDFFGENEDDLSCDCLFCRKEDAPDEILLNATLKHFGLKREHAINFWLLERRDDHVWEVGWEETGNSHPGFGGSSDILGHYVSQCEKCGMYAYEFSSGTKTPGKYEGRLCKVKIREI